MAEPPHRLFVAVPVPPEALAACRTLLDGVRAGPNARGARWVRTENLHLTVRFLGEVDPERGPALGDALREAARGRPRFGVELAGAGAFPSPSRPRSLWLAITRGGDGLTGLAHALERPLAEIGWAPEARPFVPHLTVGRTDAAGWANGAATAAALIAAARDWRVEFDADRVVLYRSHLGGGPPRYEPVVEVPLEG